MWIWKPSVLLASCLGFLAWREMSKPPPAAYLQSWQIPRTITTTNGQVFQNVTIRSLTRDGGVIINHGANAVKLPSGAINAEVMAIIVKTAPASGVAETRQSPYTINPNTLHPPRPARGSHQPPTLPSHSAAP